MISNIVRQVKSLQTSSSISGVYWGLQTLKMRGEVAVLKRAGADVLAVALPTVKSKGAAL